MSSEYQELLEKLLNSDTTDVIPQSRAEYIMLTAINSLGIDTLPEPGSRMEAYLMALITKLENSGSSEDGIRTETIVDAINFPQSMKVKKGTVVIDDRFVVSEAVYGVVDADHAIKLKCYCSASGSYTTYLTVNGVEQNATLEYLDYNGFNLVFSDGDVSRKIAFIDDNASIGTLDVSGLSDGDIIEVKVSYASECDGASTLTSDNLKKYSGILSVTDDRENIFSIAQQRQYVSNICETIGTINRITATSLGLTSDKKNFYIYPSKTSLCATAQDITAPHHKIYELGTLPNGLRLVYQACENSTTPFTDVNDIIVFTWAETPGTFRIESGRGYLSKAHTLVKNFDSFKANTTYVIWVRSSVVFAFEAQTGELTIN